MQLLLLLLITVTAPVTLAGSREYTVEHKFSPLSDFTTRGTLECSLSTKLHCSIYNSDDLFDSFTTSLTGDDFYYIRVCNKDQCVQSFIKQCLLIESNFHELLELSTSASHDIAGISILTPLQFCNGTRSGRAFDVHTKLEVIETASPAEPETSLYVKRVEAEKKRKQQGDGEDNRSFIAKYWMYIVPVLLLVMLSSQGEQGGE